MAQSVAWKRAAEAHGHASTGGTWAAEAPDRYLDALRKAGKPVPLAWSRFGRFTVRLMDGREAEVPGRTSPPFGIFRGNATGSLGVGAGRHFLVCLPGARIVATMATERYRNELAGELSRVWGVGATRKPLKIPCRSSNRSEGRSARI
jgi:hypothetical protein